MLVEFRVENFKNFKSELIYKLDQIKNYEFSIAAIKENVVKTSLIYGMNGSGKSNLGLAIFDISSSLTDKRKNENYFVTPFINLYNNKGNAKFYYKFKFASMNLIYRYEKDDPQHMIKEELFINDKRVIYYDHIKHEGEVTLSGTETLNKDLNEKNMSFVKYVRSNSVLTKDEYNDIFEMFINFVDNMLLFSSLENNHYQGFKNGNSSIAENIIEKGKLHDFEDFLRSAGIEYSLSEGEVDGQKVILCDFNGNKVNFYKIASRGTYSLILFYHWLLDLDNVSLVFIDEFDAFYHNELARKVVEEVLKSKVQAIIAANNTSIIDNNLLRPDCYFIIDNGMIGSFANSTQKELRKAHNIEKMYRAGVFSIY